jgi:hypothetical protein
MIASIMGTGWQGFEAPPSPAALGGIVSLICMVRRDGCRPIE